MLERYIFLAGEKNFCLLKIGFALKQKHMGMQTDRSPFLCKKEPVSGKISAYDRPLEVAKKSHMVEPTGDTELGGRSRRVDA